MCQPLDSQYCLRRLQAVACRPQENWPGWADCIWVHSALSECSPAQLLTSWPYKQNADSSVVAIPASNLAAIMAGRADRPHFAQLSPFLSPFPGVAVAASQSAPYQAAAVYCRAEVWAAAQGAIHTV